MTWARCNNQRNEKPVCIRDLYFGGGCDPVGGGVFGNVPPGLFELELELPLEWPLPGVVLPVGGGVVLPVGGGVVLLVGGAVPSLVGGSVGCMLPGFELADPGLFELGSLALGLFGFDEPGFMFPGEPLPAPGVCGVLCGFVPPVERFPAVPAPGVEPCPAEPCPVEPCPVEPCAPPAEPAEPLPPAPPAPPPPACATAHAEQARSTMVNADFLRDVIFVLDIELLPRRRFNLASPVSYRHREVEVRARMGRCSRTQGFVNS